MIYLEEGEIYDMYGGDETWRDTWAEYEDGEWRLYFHYYGAKPSDTEEIYPQDDTYDGYMTQLKNHPEYHE